MRWFADAEVTLVALDLGIDTSTPGGRHAAWVLSRLGEWEGERTSRPARGLTPPRRTRSPSTSGASPSRTPGGT